MRKPPLQRVEALFHQVTDLAPEQRRTFLDLHCAGDTALRSAIEELLKYDAGPQVTGSFLVSPVVRPTDVSPAPVLPALPGYEVLEELGRGGMGVVYKARQIALNRLVALKMLLSGPAITAEQLTRFRIEAEALARLQHPNIVQIFEIGEQEGRPYFSMEYVAGPSLAHDLQGVPQPAQAAAQIVEIVARAVDAVHRCGIIHRDLKPANILLQRVFPADNHGTQEIHEKECSGRAEASLALRTFAVKDFIPKVSDFGLAKLVKDASTSQKLTEPGQALGTPSYMAPEQAWGKIEALGPATDVYALGAILYEMVTGKPPFEGETPTETILQLLSQEPVPPTRLRPALSRDIETICLKCLEKEPTKRYASALALAEDLRRLQAGEPIRARPINAAERAYRWCRRRPLIAALLTVTATLALALVATVLVYNARLQQALAESQQRAEDEREQLVQRDVLIGMRSLENRDAFTGLLWFTEALRLEEGNTQQEAKHRTRIALALQRCPQLVQLLAPEGRIVAAQLSAAGPWMIVSCQDRTIRIWNVMSGETAHAEMEIEGDVRWAEISPSARFFATILRDQTVHIWDRGQSDRISFFVMPPGVAIRKVAFDIGSRVLLTQHEDFTIELWDLAKNVPLRLERLPAGKLRYSVFSSDGKWVFLLDADHIGRVWDAKTGEALVGSLHLEQEVAHAALSPDGRRLVLIDTDNQIQIGEFSSGRVVCGPWKHPCSVRRVSFSPQGDRILTAGDDNAVRIWQAATSELVIPPLRCESTITLAQFSPDGRFVILAGTDNQARVWEVATGKPLTPPLKHNGSVVSAAFSADGRRILTIGADDTVRVWEVPQTTERDLGKAIAPEAVPPRKGTGLGAWRITKVEHDTALQVMDAVTGVPVGPLLRHPSKIESAELSPDGRRILTAGDDNTAQVWDVLSGERLIPPCRHKGTVRWAAFSPDGRRLITASDDHTARVWDAFTGEPLTPSLHCPQPVVQARFSPDGSQAIATCAGGTVHTWSLLPDHQPVARLLLLAQVLTGSRIDEKQGVLPLDRKSLQAAWQTLRSHPATVR